MIRYALACGNGHAFDAWFRSADDFDRRRGGHVLSCPVCDSPDVDKTLMAPAIGRSVPDAAPAASGPAASSAAPAGVAATGGRMAPAEAAGAHVYPAGREGTEIRAALRELRRRVTAEADYVGPGFADEARRIHYGEAPERGIWGEATADEVRALLEEEILVQPLPPLPEDAN